jgi:NADPH-dependent 2,4-dienoyl-CoA reductase/sulfur reductase-like enzyme
MGASFIGLEVAASLRARRHRSSRRGAGEAADGARAGPTLGDFVRSLHEEHGVIFHSGGHATAIDARQGRR